MEVDHFERPPTRAQPQAPPKPPPLRLRKPPIASPLALRAESRFCAGWVIGVGRRVGANRLLVEWMRVR